MYPVSALAARTSFLLTLAFMGISACSSQVEAPHPLRVTPEVLQDTAICESFDGGVLAPNSIIKCHDSEGPIFATLLEDCSMPEKFTFQATTRQLLVGMAGLSIISQTPVALDHAKTLHSVVRGTVDAEPVLLSTFTSRKGGCITDLVLWQAVQSGEPAPQKVEHFTEASRTLAALLVPPTSMASVNPGGSKP